MPRVVTRASFYSIVGGVFGTFKSWATQCTIHIFKSRPTTHIGVNRRLQMFYKIRGRWQGQIYILRSFRPSSGPHKLKQGASTCLPYLLISYLALCQEHLSHLLTMNDHKHDSFQCLSWNSYQSYMHHWLHIIMGALKLCATYYNSRVIMRGEHWVYANKINLANCFVVLIFMHHNGGESKQVSWCRSM